MNIQDISDEIVKTGAAYVKANKVAAFEKSVLAILERHLKVERSNRITTVPAFQNKSHKTKGHAVLTQGESERGELKVKKGKK